MRSWLPVLGAMSLALAACGPGGGSNQNGGGFAVPFQAANTTASYSAPGSGLPNLVPGGPSSASAAFTLGAGITGSGGAPGDTIGNSVTLTTNVSGNLFTIAINIAAPGGTGPALSQSFAAGATATTTITDTQFAALLQQIAISPATTANAIYQGAVADLSYSAYGAWMQSIGGGSYNVGMYSFGPETTVMPVAGTATYQGTTVGFGAYNSGPTNQPFTLTGSVLETVNFATGTVTGLTFSGLTTQDVNDANPGPALGTITGAGAIVGNKYSFALAGNSTPGGALTGTVNGMFYGPTANETGGSWRAGNVGNTLTVIGGFGAK